MYYAHQAEFEYKQAAAHRRAEQRRIAAEIRQRAKYRGARRRRQKHARRRDLLREQLA